MSATSARDRWFPLVRELEASGLPLPEFADRRDVNPNTLSWWRSLFRREARDLAPHLRPVFSELTVVESPTVAEVDVPHVVLTLPRVAAQVRVEAGTDLRLLRAVVEALCS